MVRILWLVLLDLLAFIGDELKCCFRLEKASSALAITTNRHVTGSSAAIVDDHVTQPALPLLLPAEDLASVLPSSTQPLLLNAFVTSPTSTASGSTIMGELVYVSVHQGARLFTAPLIDFDMVSARLPYGQALRVLALSGRFVEVIAGNRSGYVLKDEVNRTMTDIWPTYQKGQIYDAEHPVTGLIRSVCADEFLARELQLPLQAGEYISMRLRKDNMFIPWDESRPRLPGRIHHLLRGKVGVYIGVVAKTDSIMEWQNEDGEGRLTYVESVLPDDTIMVSGIGLAVAGEYTELILPAHIWREWRPVFISVGV